MELNGAAASYRENSLGEAHMRERTVVLRLMRAFATRAQPHCNRKPLVEIGLSEIASSSWRARFVGGGQAMVSADMVVLN